VIRKPDGEMARAVKVGRGKKSKDGFFSFSATGRRIKAASGNFVTALHFGIRLSYHVFSPFYGLSATKLQPTPNKHNDFTTSQYNTFYP